MDYFEKKLLAVNKTLTVIGFAAMVVMMLILVLNIITRALNVPILGMYEIVQLVIVVVFSFGIGYSTLEHSHVRMKGLVSKLPPKASRIVETVSNIFNLAIWALVGWRVWILASENAVLGERTDILGLPVYLFRFVFAFGMFMMVLALIAEVLRTVFSERR